MKLKTTPAERKKLLSQIQGMRFVCCLDSPNMHNGSCFVGRLEAALEDLETSIEEVDRLAELVLGHR